MWWPCSGYVFTLSSPRLFVRRPNNIGHATNTVIPTDRPSGKNLQIAHIVKRASQFNSENYTKMRVDTTNVHWLKMADRLERVKKIWHCVTCVDLFCVFNYLHGLSSFSCQTVIPPFFFFRYELGQYLLNMEKRNTQKQNEMETNLKDVSDWASF